MKPRTRPPASASATIPPPSPKLPSPPMTRGRGGIGKGTDPSRNDALPFSFPVTGKERGRGGQRSPSLKNCCEKSTLDAERDWSTTGEGADSDINMNRMEKAKTKQNAKDVEEKKIARFQHSGPSSSSSSSTITTSDKEDNDECGEQGAASTATPVSPGLEHIASMPVPIHSTSYSISSSSSSLSSLSSSVTPSPSGPLVSNSGDVEVDADDDVDVEYGTRQMKGRVRELKTRFLKFRDELERIIGRLEDLEGGEDGDLGQGGEDGGLIDHPSLVSRASHTESKRKRKDNDLDIEIRGVVESGGAILDYVNAAVGVDADALAALKDISAQTVDASSAIPLHSTDDLSNVTKKNFGKIKPTLSLKSKTDESIPSLKQFVNTASNLSTMVDNLVSIKMLSMMQTLVKSSVGGNGNSKAKLVERSTANTNATTNITKSTTSEPDSDLICQPSPSSSSLSVSTASHSMNASDNIMSSLLEELKNIKQEARCREQSEKEDLLAMRQLHSAEVDALRRRLSYLESRTLSPDRWDLNNCGGASASGRWKASRVDDSLEIDRHRHHQYRFFEDSGTSRSFRQQQYGDRSQAFQQNGLTHYSSRSNSIINPEGASTSTNSTATPLSSREPNTLPLPPLSVTSSTATADSTISSSTPTSLPTPPPPTLSDKHYSSGYSKDNNNHYHGMGMDLDDDTVVNLPLPLPLPIKSQRKHHIMALTRAHFP